MKVFIICSVRDSNIKYKERLESYASMLKHQGYDVYLPHRDTDQKANSIEICRQNMYAIKESDQVHIFYNSTSQGTHFDMGVAFALKKPVVVVENESCEEGKSFPKMLKEWENNE